MRKTYILYDERARLDGTDDATVLDTADTEEEAKKVWEEGKERNYLYFKGSIWAEYDVADNNSLINENLHWDWDIEEGVK